MSAKALEELKKLVATAERRDLSAAIDQLPEKTKQAIADQLRRGIDQPSQKTRDVLWIAVVFSFAILLIGAAITLVIGVFSPQSSTTMMVKPEIVLSIFTSAVGFLAGLFVPSPAGNSQPRT
jgi:VIT1/CCC1 family predicted Fe2+/Mn2+ transporter